MTLLSALRSALILMTEKRRTASWVCRSLVHQSSWPPADQEAASTSIGGSTARRSASGISCSSPSLSSISIRTWLRFNGEAACTLGEVSEYDAGPQARELGRRFTVTEVVPRATASPS